VRLEGLGKYKKSTSSGFDPATFVLPLAKNAKMLRYVYRESIRNMFLYNFYIVASHDLLCSPTQYSLQCASNKINNVTFPSCIGFGVVLKTWNFVLSGSGKMKVLRNAQCVGVSG
jgi:hypothetical protein